MKQTPWVVMMPEGWGGEKPCALDCIECPCFGEVVATGGECPLANAKKAVEATTDDMETYEDKATGEQTVNGKPVTLYTVEMEAIK